jgi:DNA-binding NarL/FixJ family response regulator
MLNRKPEALGLNHLAALVRTAVAANPVTIDGEAHMRRMVADLCRILGDRVVNSEKPSTHPTPLPEMPPRMRQTLDALLAGDSEKQIANKLQISQHTVHVYVKGLYRRFDVCSRGELLSRFIQK